MLSHLGRMMRNPVRVLALVHLPRGIGFPRNGSLNFNWQTEEAIGQVRRDTIYKVIDKSHAAITDDRSDSATICKARVDRLLKWERSFLVRQISAGIVE